MQEIERLKDVMSGVSLDLLVGGRLNAAPGREKVARRVLEAGLSGVSADDLDYIVFKSMTTMGNQGTFMAALPWFLDAVIRWPNRGYMVGPELLIQKLEAALFKDWDFDKRFATLAALRFYMKALIGLDAEDPEISSLEVWLVQQADQILT